MLNALGELIIMPAAATAACRLSNTCRAATVTVYEFCVRWGGRSQFRETLCSRTAVEIWIMKISIRGFRWFVFTRDSRMLRASLPSSGRPSVCPSVCPSVTLVSCIKTVQARVTKSSPWTAPRSLVYRDKISCHWVQEFPSNEGVEEGYPLKKTSFSRYWLE